MYGQLHSKRFINLQFSQQTRATSIFQVNSHMNITLKILILWDDTPYRLLNNYQHYEWSSCLHLQHQAFKEDNSIFTQLFTWKNVTAICRNFSIFLITLCLACHKHIIMWNVYVCTTLPSKHILFLFFIIKFILSIFIIQKSLRSKRLQK